MLRILFVLALVCLPASAAAQELGFDGCEGKWDTPFTSVAITDPKRPGAYHVLLKGNVRFTCKDMTIWADEVEGDSDRDLVELRGNVVIDRPDLKLYADHAVLDRRSRNGTLFNVHGSSQTSHATPEKDQFGGMEPDFTFWAAELEKTGPESFELKNGSVTSCVQATPRWMVSGTSGTLVHNKRVTFKNAVISVKGVPVFYVPYIYYPINKEDRSTGFLMPSFGSSRVGGFQISNAFFWAIDRSTDATFYYDYLKRAGNGVGAEYRFASAPGSNGDLKFYSLKQRANTVFGTFATRSYMTTGHLNYGLGGGLRLVGLVSYASNPLTQQLFQQNVFDMTNRTRDIDFSLSGGRGRYSGSVNVARHDVFQGYTTAARNGNAPRVTLSMADAPIGRSKVYFGAGGEAGYLVSEGAIDNPATDRSLARFDARPRVNWPISSLPFLRLTTSAAWEITQWTESLNPLTGLQEATPLTRNLFSTDVRLTGPTFARIWQPQKSKYADRVKHVIEPTIGVQWLSDYADLTRIVQIDSIDFLPTGTRTIAYGLSNRVLIRKRAAEGAQGPVREVLSVDVTQSSYSNSRAAIADPLYLPCSTGTFSPVKVTVNGHPSERTTGQFWVDINPQFQTPCTLNASGTFRAALADLSLGWTKRQYIPGLKNFDNPDLADNFLNGGTSFRRPNGHLGGTYAIQYDLRRSRVVQQRLGVFYNSQCCGISVDYQRQELITGTFNQQNNRFNFAFTLAGIGSFSNPLGSFGGR
jgi:LPS-assembly protein